MSDIKSLSDFYAEMANKGLRLQHQFQVQFSPSPGALAIIGDDSLKQILENVSYYATTAQLPGRTQNIHTRTYLGYPFQIPTTMDYTKTLSLTMLCDSGKPDAESNAEVSSLLRTALLKWMNYHSNLSLSDGINGYNAGGVKRIPIESKILLSLLDENLETVVERYILHGAFPGEIGSLNLSHESSEPATFDLSLAYQFFTLTK
jgi:hypothetical protein